MMEVKLGRRFSGRPARRGKQIRTTSWPAVLWLGTAGAQVKATSPENLQLHKLHFFWTWSNVLIPAVPLRDSAFVMSARPQCQHSRSTFLSPVPLQPHSQCREMPPTVNHALTCHLSLAFPADPDQPIARAVRVCVPLSGQYWMTAVPSMARQLAVIHQLSGFTRVDQR